MKWFTRWPRPTFLKFPAWLNEGLGSLFEASDRADDDKVIGITNWRLEGLQRDLKQNTATKFGDLLGMEDGVFYGERSGANYAASRYLMQWLQEQGKLESFYTRIRDKKDKDAAASLLAVFDNKKTYRRTSSRVLRVGEEAAVSVVTRLLKFQNRINGKMIRRKKHAFVVAVDRGILN